MKHIPFENLAVGDVIHWSGCAGNHAVVIDVRGGATIVWLGLDDHRHQATLDWSRGRDVSVYTPEVFA